MTQQLIDSYAAWILDAREGGLDTRAAAAHFEKQRPTTQDRYDLGMAISALEASGCST